MKTRSSIPKAISEAGLKEYHHRCAVCGRHDPQLHHIDEDPSHNDSNNLLPLCPNCHLQDTHAPTTPLDPQKILLFRRCKDPCILDPRFHPIWTRLRYLRESEETRVVSWKYSCNDLMDFVKALQMGEYYAKQINSVLVNPFIHWFVHLLKQGQVVTEEALRADTARQQEFHDYTATAIEDICVEMLRYQGWLPQSPTMA